MTVVTGHETHHCPSLQYSLYSGIEQLVGRRGCQARQSAHARGPAAASTSSPRSGSPSTPMRSPAVSEINRSLSSRCVVKIFVAFRIEGTVVVDFKITQSAITVSRINFADVTASNSFKTAVAIGSILSFKKIILIILIKSQEKLRLDNNFYK